MKTILYAVNPGETWHWRISLDFAVDVRFWLAQSDAHLRILWLEPAFSFGQALQLAQQLNRFDWKRMTGEQAVQRAMRSGYFRCLPENVLRELTWSELDSGSGEPGGGFGWNGQSTDSDSGGEAAGRLSVLLSGRSLLPEELQSLLEFHGFRDAASRWKTYIQYAYLQGKVNLVHGVTGHVKRPFPYMRAHVEYRCVRCGSQRLHWTDCSVCGTLCPYCEECLTMGRVRFCTPLVQGEESGEAARGYGDGDGMPTAGAATDRRAGADFGRPAGCFAERRNGPAAEPRGDRDAEPSGIPDAVPSGSAPAHTPSSDALSASELLDRWGLSPAQKAASAAGIRFLSNPARIAGKRGEEKAGCFLIWAVTGAGKTEMIFPLIDAELARGGLVCVATPRRDVVLELKPRIAKAFPGRSVVTLYGGSEQRWEQGDVTIATTHQLLRFRGKFDLIILDELDAFPFHNNPMLEYAAEKACKPGGKYVFLSATPPRHLQKAVKAGKLPHAKVPVRFHRHPLPVPAYIKMKHLQQLLSAQQLPHRLLTKLQASIERGAQLFLFVPAIKLVEPLVSLLRRSFPGLVIDGTSSKDPERARKVQMFRDGQIRLLVTTTILERGVTVPKTDVFILDAGSPLFDEAALVQMSGRAGRSQDDPAGFVYFAAQEKTASQVKAIRHIKAMNRLASKKGYLLVEDPRQRQRR